jgi:hypothetical protein
VVLREVGALDVFDGSSVADGDANAIRGKRGSRLR